MNKRNRERLPDKQGPLRPNVELAGQQNHPAQTQHVFKTESYQGIYPHPDHLQRLADVNPDFPERIMGWTEDELAHNRAMDRRVLNYTFWTRIIDNLFGLLAVVILSGVGVYFMLHGHANAGATIITGTAVAAAGTFVVRKVRSSRESAQNKPKKKDE